MWIQRSRKQRDSSTARATPLYSNTLQSMLCTFISHIHCTKYWHGSKASMHVQCLLTAKLLTSKICGGCFIGSHRLVVPQYIRNVYIDHYNNDIVIACQIFYMSLWTLTSRFVGWHITQISHSHSPQLYFSMYMYTGMYVWDVLEPVSCTYLCFISMK